MMKFKTLFAIFLVVSLYSCATFQQVETSQKSANGTFSAFYNQKVFEGFFSVSQNSLRFDIVNTFGFSIYGIYAKGNDVYLKDYQNGEEYSNIKIDNEDLSVYKPLILHLMRNFDTICRNNNNQHIVILSCKAIGSEILPTSIILENKDYKRLRLNFYKIQLKNGQGAEK
jgi:hypothetical protein